MLPASRPEVSRLILKLAVWSFLRVLSQLKSAGAANDGFVRPFLLQFPFSGQFRI